MRVEYGTYYEYSGKTTTISEKDTCFDDFLCYYLDLVGSRSLAALLSLEFDVPEQFPGFSDNGEVAFLCVIETICKKTEKLIWANGKVIIGKAAKSSTQWTSITYLIIVSPLQKLFSDPLLVSAPEHWVIDQKNSLEFQTCRAGECRNNDDFVFALRISAEVID